MLTDKLNFPVQKSLPRIGGTDFLIELVIS